MKLLVNYRSHSGVLDCAAAILSVLFAAYPGSAKALPADAGLFKGPRPMYFQGFQGHAMLPTKMVDNSTDISAGLLSVVEALLRRNERFVVICPDEEAERVSDIVRGWGWRTWCWASAHRRV
jgi:hypothetical protein